MNYLEVKDNKIVKYSVKVNTKQLEKLKYEIITNCSYIRHIEGEFTGDRIPPQYTIEDLLTYRHLQKSFLKERANNDFEYNPQKYYEIYYVSYNEYIFPQIVNDINNILNYCKQNKTDIIENYEIGQILNWLYESTNTTPCEVIMKKVEELNAKLLDEKTSINEKQDTLNQLREYTYNYELNQEQVCLDNYKEKIIGCFQLNVLDNIDINILKQVYSFLDSDLKEKIKPYISINVLKELDENNKSPKIKIIKKTG